MTYHRQEEVRLNEPAIFYLPCGENIRRKTKTMTKTSFVRKESFWPESLSPHFECSFNNNAENSARYTNQSKYFHCNGTNFFLKRCLGRMEISSAESSIFFPGRPNFFTKSAKNINFSRQEATCICSESKTYDKIWCNFNKKYSFPKIPLDKSNASLTTLTKKYYQKSQYFEIMI